MTHFLKQVKKWVLIIRIVLQAIGFKLNIGLTMEIYTYALLFLANIPIALALLKSHDEAVPVGGVGTLIHD